MVLYTCAFVFSFLGGGSFISIAYEAGGVSTGPIIFTIVNAGHSDKVMEAARKAGATGGTMIHARGLASEEVKKFLAITIQPEKDIVLIVAPHEKNHPIMESIAKEVGLGSEAKGICFSLPVNRGLIPPEENEG